MMKRFMREGNGPRSRPSPGKWRKSLPAKQNTFCLAATVWKQLPQELRDCKIPRKCLEAKRLEKPVFSGSKDRDSRLRRFFARYTWYDACTSGRDPWRVFRSSPKFSSGALCAVVRRVARRLCLSTAHVTTIKPPTTRKGGGVGHGNSGPASSKRGLAVAPSSARRVSSVARR